MKRSHQETKKAKDIVKKTMYCEYDTQIEENQKKKNSTKNLIF
jgi:hypothetical protein